MQMTAEKWLYMASETRYDNSRNINLIVANKQFFSQESIECLLTLDLNLVHMHAGIQLTSLYHF